MDLAKIQTNRRSFRDYLWLAARGFAMGAADVVPGVSGGTMAFILGIYEELIHAIHAVDGPFIRRLFSLRVREAFADFPWRFLLVLALGLGTAILTLAQGISWALHEHPVFIWAFFFGLVLGSVIAVRRRVVRWTPGALLATGLAALLAYLIVGMVPAETPDAPWFIFLSGALAINAMILPGLSGAFILVLLGKYHYILEAVVNANFVPLLILMAGAAVGLLSFVRVLRWMFTHYHDLTVAALIGLMLGALRKVWPWKEEMVIDAVRSIVHEINVLPQAFNLEVVGAAALAAVGFGLVLMLENVASRQHHEPAISEVNS